MLDLGLVVVLVGLGADLDLLDLHDGMTLLGVLLLLLLLVLELAVVHDAADRRLGVGRDLDEVAANFLGHGNGLAALQYAQLLSFGADDAHLARPDHVVASHPVVRHAPAGSDVRRSYSSSLLA